MADIEQQVANAVEAVQPTTPSERFQALKDRERDVRNQVKDLEAKRQAEYNMIRESYAPQIKVLTDSVDSIRKEREECLKDILSNPASLEFEGWDAITHKDLRKMPITKLEFLVYKVSGETNKFENVPDTTNHASPHERKVNNIRYLLRSGCSYCHSLSHNINACPTRKPCYKCGEMGHSPKRCKSKSNEKSTEKSTDN